MNSRYELFCYKITRHATRHWLLAAIANVIIAAALVGIIEIARNIGMEGAGDALSLCVTAAVIIVVAGFLQFSLAFGIALALVRGSDWGEQIEGHSYDSDSEWM